MNVRTGKGKEGQVWRVREVMRKERKGREQEGKMSEGRKETIRYKVLEGSDEDVSERR